MRRTAFQAAFAIAALGLAAASPAAAANAPQGPRWITCYVLDQVAGKKWVSAIYQGSSAEVRDGQDYGWLQYVKANFAPTSVTGGCTAEDTREDAEWRHAVFTDEDPVHPAIIVEVAEWAPGFGVALTNAEPAPIEVAEATPVPAEPPTSVITPAPMVRALSGRAADSDAEFQRKYSDYQRQLAEQQRAVNAYREAQAELTRKKAEQRLAAAKAETDYALQMQEHEAVVRRHDAEIARYQAIVASR